jgi:hypothetical protein
MLFLHYGAAVLPVAGRFFSLLQYRSLLPGAKLPAN